MLTLNQPIKLSAGLPLTASFHMFSEKIRANYGLMAAQISPKKLLLLVTSPPELPELPGAQGSMTSIVINSREQNIRSTSMEVINNVVNRILLENHADFTYQDSVYITTVLNKLGITDISRFMKQVRVLMEQDTNVYRLSQMYQNHLELFNTLSQRMQKEKAAASPAAETKDTEIPSTSRYYIHNEIYHRLGTAQIYRTMQSAQVSQSSFVNNLFHTELRIAEQLRISRELSLFQIKQQTFSASSLTLNHVNRYETGEMSAPPRTEEEVLLQGAEAVLVSIADNVMVSRIEQILSHRDFWFNIRTAISRSAQNSLTRFQIYHTQPTVSAYEGDEYTEQVSRLYQQETNTVSHFIQEFTQLQKNSYVNSPNADSFLRSVKLDYLNAEKQQESLPDETTQNQNEKQGKAEKQFDPKMLAQVTQQLLSGDRPEAGDKGKKKSAGTPEAERLPQMSPEQLIYQLENRYYQSILQLSKEEKHLTERLEQRDEHNREVYREAFLQSRLDKNETVEHINRISTESNRETGNPAVPKTDSVAGSTEEFKPPAPEQLVYQQQNLSTEPVAEIPGEKLQIPGKASQSAEPSREIEKETITQELNSNDAAQVLNQFFSTVNMEHAAPPAGEKNPVEKSLEEQTVLSREKLVFEQEHRSTETIHDTADENTILLQNLKEINEHNLERYREVLAEQEAAAQKQAPQTVLDNKKMMKDALRSMENPEQVMQEIISAASELPPPKATSGNPQIDMILAHAGEETRSIIESVLQYQQNPLQAIAAGKIRPASLGEINTVIREVREQQAVETEHLIQREIAESEPVRRQIEDVMEQLSGNPAAGNAAQGETGYGKPDIPMVHRRQENQVSEELLELLEQRKQESRQVETSEVVTQETVNQTQQSTVNQKPSEQTPEDIAALVTRTLNRQMNTITDQVYGQMERKLQLERSRRGWQ